MRGRIRGNTEIGPVLDMKVSHHQGRCGVEIMNPNFCDRTVSWVRVVNGINKYVTETSGEILVASVARGYGEYNSRNSRDFCSGTFGERTVLESELEVPII